MLHQAALRLFGVLPRRARTAVVRVMYPTFTAGVGVCLRNSDGQIALATHSYSPGWGLPGGLVGRDEDVRTTAERELLEELGIQVELEGQPVPVLTPGRRHFNFLFHAELPEQQASSLASHSPEITDVDWFSLESLPELAEFTDLFLVALGVVKNA